ncbi:MAG: Uma2 family endonuclease [Cyanobacteria bacterium J06627_28]
MVLAISPKDAKTYTAEEYLALEVASKTRNEFRNGEILPMTGGTPVHNEITSSMLLSLKGSLRKQPYCVFVTDQRLWIPKANLYTYPDLMVTPRPCELKAGRKDTIINPILVVETLSISTQSYDRGDKFSHYRTIDSFREYVLIAQHQPRVEHYVKQDTAQWLLTEHAGLKATFHLSSVDIEIALADLYENIEFDEPIEFDKPDE